LKSGFKPYIKCLISSSSLIFYNTEQNNLINHIKPELSSFANSFSISNINTLIYNNNTDFPNQSSNQISINNNLGIYSLNWPNCNNNGNNNENFFLYLKNIADKNDSSLPYPTNGKRSFITFQNKFYIKAQIKHYVNDIYYRIFPYNQLTVDSSKFENLFFTKYTIAKIDFSFVSNGSIVSDAYLATADICSNLGDINFTGNVFTMSNDFQSLFNSFNLGIDISNSNFQNIDTSKICGFLLDPNTLYFTSDTDADSSKNLEIHFNYYPHYGLETLVYKLTMNKRSKSDFKYLAKITDFSGNQINSDSVSQPIDLLIAYDTYTNSFTKITYSTSLSGGEYFIPELVITLMGNRIQIYDMNSNTFKNDIQSNILHNYINKEISFKYSESQNNNNLDNYKNTIHGYFRLKNHSLRYNKNFSINSKNLKLFSDDLENFNSASFDYDNTTNMIKYIFLNSFYFNLVFVKSQLFLTINIIDPQTFTKTTLCTINNNNYYNLIPSNYFNTNNFKNFPECKINVFNNDVLILNFDLINTSDKQDYYYQLSTNPTLSFCNNLMVNENLIFGSYLVLDFKNNFLNMNNATNNVLNISLNLYISHKSFSIINNISTKLKFKYQELSNIKQAILAGIPITIKKFIKPPKFQKFWGNSNLSYDSPSSQALFGKEGNLFTYNLNVLSDNILTPSNFIMNVSDKYNSFNSLTGLPENNTFTISLVSCNSFQNFATCFNDGKIEDLNYSYICKITLNFTPRNMQFDSGLVIVKATDPTSNLLFSYYYFNIGYIEQVNDLPKINGFKCQEIIYNSVKVSNQILTDCTKDSANSNRFILLANNVYILKLLWTDIDSFPISNNLNSENSYYDFRLNNGLEIQEKLFLFPPFLTFSVDIPANVASAFTQISYDVWIVKLLPKHLTTISNNKITINISITDQEIRINGNGFIKSTSPIQSQTFDFSISSTANLPYLIDYYSYKSYDNNFNLIAAVFQDTDTSSIFQFKKFLFPISFYSEQITINPNVIQTFELYFSDTLYGYLNFQNQPPNNINQDTAKLNMGSNGLNQNLNAVITSSIANQDNSFISYNQKLIITNNSNIIDFPITFCQLFFCRNRTILYSVSSNTCDITKSCLKNDIINLVGINIPNSIKFLDINLKNNNLLSKVKIAHTDCNSPSNFNINNFTVSCSLPNIRGRNQFIWIWNDNYSTIPIANSFSTCGITYSELFPNLIPILYPFNIFSDPNTYFIQSPNPIKVYGNNLRVSCNCVLQCGSKTLILITFLKSQEHLICDYTNIANPSDYLDTYCSLKVICLDHPSYKRNGFVYNYDTVVNKDIIYESVLSLTIFIEEIKIKSVNFISEIDRSLVEKYNELTGPFPHSHGGYIVQVSYSKIPKCLKDSKCDFSTFYFGIDVYVIKSNCSFNNNNTEIICSYLSPIIENLSILSYLIYLSFDYGITYTHKSNSIKINLSGICKEGYFCLNFKQEIVPKGYFCDIVPKKATDIYCKYARKCMPGNYFIIFLTFNKLLLIKMLKILNFDKILTNLKLGTFQSNDKQTSCTQVSKGYYLNFFGSDGINVPPKICPKGFICRDRGLPKYYEICRVLYQDIYLPFTLFTKFILFKN